MENESKQIQHHLNPQYRIAEQVGIAVTFWTRIGRCWFRISAGTSVILRVFMICLSPSRLIVGDY
jgi:hypothetical protein